MSHKEIPESGQLMSPLWRHIGIKEKRCSLCQKTASNGRIIDEVIILGQSQLICGDCYILLRNLTRLLTQSKFVSAQKLLEDYLLEREK